MNTENQTLDNTMRQKYFLVSKKWTVVVLLLALLAYAGAVLWSEFVFSVRTSDGIKQLEADKKTSHINCKDIVQFNVKPTELTPKRNPWLLETFNVYSSYSDALIVFPHCLSASVVWTEAGVRNTRFYYFDRNTNKPIVKVTIESVK